MMYASGSRGGAPARRAVSTRLIASAPKRRAGIQVNALARHAERSGHEQLGVEPRGVAAGGLELDRGPGHRVADAADGRGHA